MRGSRLHLENRFTSSGRKRLNVAMLLGGRRNPALRRFDKRWFSVSRLASDQGNKDETTISKVRYVWAQRTDDGKKLECTVGSSPMGEGGENSRISSWHDL